MISLLLAQHLEHVVVSLDVPVLLNWLCWCRMRHPMSTSPGVHISVMPAKTDDKLTMAMYNQHSRRQGHVLR